MEKYSKYIDEDAQWGGLYQPLSLKKGREEGLRTVIFGSTNAGALVLDSLIRFERRHPGLLNITGVATDDPLDPNTKISVQKRIWKYYDENEMRSLMNQIVELSAGEGISCYTGNVKTGYFREILRKWDPEVIIMCCFGQKIDAVIYDYPVFGMYNFHPSDLASRIGEGSKPFHGTMSNGNKTSVMTVHQVTESIDRGPIVGLSPEVKIVDETGYYPDSIITLQEKIPAICGWLSIILISEILKKRETGSGGAVSSVDFHAQIPGYIKQILMEPVKPDPSEKYILPLHPGIE